MLPYHRDPVKIFRALVFATIVTGPPCSLYSPLKSRVKLKMTKKSIKRNIFKANMKSQNTLCGPGLILLESMNFIFAQKIGFYI